MVVIVGLRRKLVIRLRKSVAIGEGVQMFMLKSPQIIMFVFEGEMYSRRVRICSKKCRVEPEGGL